MQFIVRKERTLERERDSASLNKENLFIAVMKDARIFNLLDKQKRILIDSISVLE